MTPLCRLLALRVDLRDPEAVAGITPATLAAYAERTGWIHAATTDAYRVYHRTDLPRAELQVPLHDGWPDYGRAVLREIAELAVAEGRSQLAVWADLVGLRDPVPAALADLDTRLAGMAGRARMYGTTSETVLFQALVALEVRALLRGEPDPAERYEALRRAHGIPSSLHASSRLGLDDIGEFIASLAGLTDAPPRHEAPAGGPTATTEAPEAAPASTEPATGQGVLPGVPAPTRPRRASVHRWGVIRWERLPPDPLDPEREVLAAVQTCPHCHCHRRRANTGPRLGAEDMYSRDGKEWTYGVPPCVMKG